MRLLVKTTLYYLIITLIIFGIGGLITYNIMKREVQVETDRYLIEKLHYAQEALEKDLPTQALNLDKIIIEKLPNNNLRETKPVFTDTLVYHRYLKRMEPNRKMTVVQNVQGTFYRFTIFDLIIESDDIFEGVFNALTKLFILLGIVLVTTSFFFSTLLFGPFNKTLKQLSRFKIQDQKPLQLPKTRTREFETLNGFLVTMANKGQHDYRNLKEFTENASHELQTPLAIVKGKLELLLQSGSLNKEQVKLIDSAYEAVLHLSSLGRSLALMSKIENKEFSNLQEIDFSDTLNKMVYNFRELFDLKKIQVKTQVKPGIRLKIDPYLANILLSNLLQNSIRHNVENGHVDIMLGDGSLQISNTGPKPSTDPKRLFERFRKDIQSSETSGLGLAIVKEICDAHHFTVGYSFEADLHKIIIRWSRSPSLFNDLTDSW